MAEPTGRHCERSAAIHAFETKAFCSMPMWLKKDELVENFHRFDKLKHSTVNPKAFTLLLSPHAALQDLTPNPMRLNPTELNAVHAILGELDAAGRVYLYGSRALDSRRGGDIDIYRNA